MGVEPPPLRKNIEYWDESLKNPEPLVDEYYTKNQIILRDTFVHNADILRDLLGVYCFLAGLKTVDAKAQSVQQYLMKHIDSQLFENDQLQYSEFVAFWKCSGISYSVYKKLDDTERMKTLGDLLSLYCRERKPIYDKFGYSHIVSQALYDSGASRSQGVSARRKFEAIFKSLFDDAVSDCIDINSFVGSKTAYFFPDRRNAQLFRDLREKFGLSYAYSAVSQNKLPDAIVKIGTRIYIVEAKHLQEGGGHQNEQINQLIRFISNSENNPRKYAGQPPYEFFFSYVAFLDGWYFNRFIETRSSTEQPSDSKISNQYKDIQSQLERNPHNYFVNTHGFGLLLKDSLLAEAGSSLPETFDGGD